MEDKIKLFESFLAVQWLTMIVSMLFGLKMKMKWELPYYLKIISLYVTIAGIGSVISFISFFYLPQIKASIKEFFDITIILHLSLLTIFFHSILPKKFSRYIIAVFLISLPLTILVLVNDWERELVSRSFVVANFSLVIMAIIYYWDLLNSEPKINIIHDSAFWVVTGIFIGMATNVVLITLSQVILVEYDYAKYAITSVFSSFFYAVMHGFFIKAFLCFQHSQ